MGIRLNNVVQSLPRKSSAPMIALYLTIPSEQALYLDERSLLNADKARSYLTAKEQSGDPGFLCNGPMLRKFGETGPRMVISHGVLREHNPPPPPKPQPPAPRPPQQPQQPRPQQQPRPPQQPQGFGPSNLTIGRRCTITDVKSRAELNGTFCAVVKYDEEQQRYHVRLDTTQKVVALKPANLSPVPLPPSVNFPSASSGNFPSAQPRVEPKTDSRGVEAGTPYLKNDLPPGWSGSYYVGNQSNRGYYKFIGPGKTGSSTGSVPGAWRDYIAKYGGDMPASLRPPAPAPAAPAPSRPTEFMGPVIPPSREIPSTSRAPPAPAPAPRAYAPPPVPVPLDMFQPGDNPTSTFHKYAALAAAPPPAGAHRIANLEPSPGRVLQPEHLVRPSSAAPSSSTPSPLLPEKRSNPERDLASSPSAAKVARAPSAASEEDLADIDGAMRPSSTSNE